MTPSQMISTGETHPWVYDSEFLLEDDCRKILHFAVHQFTGERKMIDWTPYYHMSASDFGTMAAMGFPPRVGGVAWRTASCAAAYAEFTKHRQLVGKAKECAALVAVLAVLVAVVAESQAKIAARQMWWTDSAISSPQN